MDILLPLRQMQEPQDSAGGGGVLLLCQVPLQRVTGRKLPTRSRVLRCSIQVPAGTAVQADPNLFR